MYSVLCAREKTANLIVLINLYSYFSKSYTKSESVLKTHRKFLIQKEKKINHTLIISKSFRIK